MKGTATLELVNPDGRTETFYLSVGQTLTIVQPVDVRTDRFDIHGTVNVVLRRTA